MSRSPGSDQCNGERWQASRCVNSNAPFALNLGCYGIWVGVSGGLMLVNVACGGPLGRGQGDWRCSVMGHRLDGRSLSWSGP